MIAKHDIKGDGVLSFEEFKQIFVQGKDDDFNEEFDAKADPPSGK